MIFPWYPILRWFCEVEISISSFFSLYFGFLFIVAGLSGTSNFDENLTAGNSGTHCWWEVIPIFSGWKWSIIERWSQFWVVEKWSLFRCFLRSEVLSFGESSAKTSFITRSWRTWNNTVSVQIGDKLEPKRIGDGHQHHQRNSGGLYSDCKDFPKKRLLTMAYIYILQDVTGNFLSLEQQSS